MKNFTKVIEKADYDPSYNIVLPVIEAIFKADSFLQESVIFEKSELERMSIWSTLGFSTETFLLQN